MIIFRKNDKLLIEVYTDVDYIESMVDRRPITSYCIFFRSNVDMWRSKKQNVVVRLIAKLEFQAIAQRVCELL